jgi:hypothetical protein
MSMLIYYYYYSAGDLARSTVVCTVINININYNIIIIVSNSIMIMNMIINNTNNAHGGSSRHLVITGMTLL